MTTVRLYRTINEQLNRDKKEIRLIYNKFKIPFVTNIMMVEFNLIFSKEINVVEKRPH